MKKLLPSYILKLFIVLSVAFLLFQGIHWWEGRGAGFRLYKIQSTPVFDERWETVFSEEDLQVAREAFSQPYYYLGHGFQVYAFSSADGKHVLKFFRHQRLRLPEFVKAIPSLPLFDEWRQSRLLSLSRRQDHLFRSSKTSWDLARYETIMEMVHLNVTKGLYSTVEIKDSLGNSYSIELDKYQFLLQKKAVLIKPTIAKLMKDGKEDEAKRRIDQILTLFVECARKGIADTDGALIRKDNLGFFEDRAIYIDGGKLTPRKHLCTKKEFVHDIKRLRPLVKWLEQEYPQLVKHFKKATSDAVKAVEMAYNEAMQHTEETQVSIGETAVSELENGGAAHV